MLLALYDQYGNEKAELQANDSSTQDKEVQADNVLSLGFTLYAHVSIDVNDYVDFGGERYWAVEKYEPAEKSSVEWEYSLKLYGIESLIKRFLVLNNTDGENEAVFTLTARPVDHVRLIVKCINDGMGTTNFKVGSVEGTDNVVINYEGKYCDEALKELAEAVGVEWWFDGETVNLSRCEWGSAVVLGYGEGLTSLEQDKADNVKFYTRLFPLGSSRNIDRERYGASRLQLPGGAKYVDLPYLVQKYGVIHHYEQEAFSGIYPRRVGVVSSVRSEEVQDSDGKPYTIYYFKDNGLTFDPNAYEIGGLVKHVSFQEGSELAGLGTDNDHYFEVNFDSETREFEIITIWPYDDDRQLPGGTLVPKPGDKYILWNIRMPDEYYTLAETEFQSAVEEYNRKHTQDASRYKAPTDHVWIEETGTELEVGRRVRLKSQEYFPRLGYRESRITRISRSVNQPSQMDIEISDALSSGTLEKIDDAISGAKSYAGSILGAVNVPDLIRSWDETKPTDNNLYSARRTHKEFLSKKNDDRANGLITFLKGLRLGAGTYGIDGGGVGSLLSLVLKSLTGESYTGTDLLGDEGFRVWTDEYGKGHIITDYLTTRIRQIVAELEVKRITFTAGNIYLSAANARFTKVVPITENGRRTYAEILSAGGEVLTGSDEVLTSDSGQPIAPADAYAYRCYWPATDGERRTSNDWNVGDMAWCQTENLTAPGSFTNHQNRQYRRLVVAVGTELVDGETCHYIDLSAVLNPVIGGVARTGYDVSLVGGNDAPMAGDEVAQVGSQTDTERQGVIALNPVSDNPNIAIYAVVKDYNLPSHRVALLSPAEVNICASYFKLSTAVGTGKTTTPLLNPTVDMWWQNGQNLSVTNSIYVDADEESKIASLSQVQGLPVKIQVRLGNVVIPCSEWTSGTVDGVTIANSSSGITVMGTGVYVKRAYKNTDSATVEWQYTPIPQLGGQPVNPVIASRKIVVSIAFVHDNQAYTVEQEIQMTVQVKGATGAAGQDGTSLNVRGEAELHYVSPSYMPSSDGTYLVDEDWNGTSGSWIVVIENQTESFTLATAGYCYKTLNESQGDASQEGHLWQAQSDGWHDIGPINASDAVNISPDPAVVILEQSLSNPSSFSAVKFGLKVYVGKNQKAYEITSATSSELNVSLTDSNTTVTVLNPYTHTVDGKTVYYDYGTILITLVSEGKTYTLTVGVGVNLLGTWTSETKADIHTEISQKSLWIEEGGVLKQYTIMSGEYMDANTIRFYVTKEGQSGGATAKIASLTLKIDGNKSKIVLDADTVEVSDNLEVKRLTTKDGGTVENGGMGHVEIHDGVQEIFNPDGQMNIRIGYSNGYMVLEFYDNDGTFLYDIGPNGITQVMNRSEKLDFIDDYVRMRVNGTAVANGVDMSFANVMNYKNFLFVATSYQDTFLRYSAKREGGAIAAGQYATTNTVAKATQFDNKLLLTNAVSGIVAGNLFTGLLAEHLSVLCTPEQLCGAEHKYDAVATPKNYDTTIQAGHTANFATDGQGSYVKDVRCRYVRLYVDGVYQGKKAVYYSTARSSS